MVQLGAGQALAMNGGKDVNDTRRRSRRRAPVSVWQYSLVMPRATLFDKATIATITRTAAAP
jgi:hypothetical protein